MKFYKYWARGEAMVQERQTPLEDCVPYGGSDNSMDGCAPQPPTTAPARTAAAIERG